MIRLRRRRRFVVFGARRGLRVEGLGVVPQAHFPHRGRGIPIPIPIPVVQVVVRAEGVLRSRDGRRRCQSRVPFSRRALFFFRAVAKNRRSAAKRRETRGRFAGQLNKLKEAYLSREHRRGSPRRTRTRRGSLPRSGPGETHAKATRGAPARRTSSSPLVNGLSIRGVELSSLAPAEAWKELVLIFAASSRPARPGSRLTPELGWCDPTRGGEHRVASQ